MNDDKLFREGRLGFRSGLEREAFKLSRLSRRDLRLAVRREQRPNVLRLALKQIKKSRAKTRLLEHRLRELNAKCKTQNAKLPELAVVAGGMSAEEHNRFPGGRW